MQIHFRLLQITSRRIRLENNEQFIGSCRVKLTQKGGDRKEQVIFQLIKRPTLPRGFISRHFHFISTLQRKAQVNTDRAAMTYILDPELCVEVVT